MLTANWRLLLTAIIGCIVLAMSAHLAVSQQYNPGFTIPPNGGNIPGPQQGIRGGLPGNGYGLAAQNGFNRGLATGAVYGAAAGYNPYGPYGYYQSPVAGMLEGTADMMTAQGQWMKDFQNASIIKEQDRQAKIDTRKKQFDEWMYERANTPTYEDERQRSWAEQLRHARSNPAPTEIYAAEPLNVLLTNIQQHPLRNPPDNVAFLGSDLLRRINFSGNAGGGNAGLLKNAGQLSWPLLLRKSDFTESRQQVNDQLAAAVKQAQGGGVNADTLSALGDAVSNMQNQLRGMVADASPNQYIEAKRYLNELQDGIRTLSGPNAANYFNGAWTPRASDVVQLVQEMTGKGLRFAPATSGDESAYMGMYNAMLNYDNIIASQVAAR
jgi:hypothetical protein